MISRPVEKNNINPIIRDIQPSHSLTRKKLIDVLHKSDWNKAEVARRVGLSRASIWKYMKKWDIPLQPEHNK